ncbi:MAG: tripartite tricarboxylate transporter permease, partial [Rhodospirillaceae bacterium]|nr:tripartite tricarboxylate transporter permease [Rhodospirillaceae bacterium]
MFDAFITGLFLVFEWPAIGFLMLGVFIGIWLGAVPGLGGIIGLVLLLPFTYGMDPVPAFALLLGMFAVTSTSDTIASVLLGIPGTAASQATILDGYPLAQQGQAARAFGAAFTVSAFGGVFGALILAASLPLILPIILAFNAPELFMLGVLGLAMVGSLSGASILKGIAVAALGILLSTVGYADTIAISRFDFGTDYLSDKLPLIPVVLGLFAIPEIMELAIRNTSISKIPKGQIVGGGMMDGVKDAFRHWWLALRCAAIGTYIGMLPGLGAAIVDWIAYGHAVQSAKDKSQFGKGDIRGVIAPEAANNATRGGSLVPTVAFGIPGSLGT